MFGGCSLDEMLESLRLRNEPDKAKDMPPVLPSRPMSRGRVPSARRSLPTGFKLSSDVFTGEYNKKLAEWDLMNKVGGNEDKRRRVFQRIVKAQTNFRARRARRNFCQLKKGALVLQAFIRANLARKHYKLGSHATGKMPAAKGILNEQQILGSLPDLQRMVFKVEADLEQKEKENAILKEQLYKFKAKRLENDMKMKSMEEVWKKQIASLQVSPAAAAAKSPTTLRSPRRNSSAPDLVAINETHVKMNTLKKEFERRRQPFDDDDARSLMDARRGRSNIDGELGRLKHKFGSWKQGYKMRLREAKLRLHTLGTSECRRRWWGRKNRAWS